MVKASRSAVKPRNSQKPGKAPSPPQLVTPSSARATIAQVVQQAEALMSAGQRDAALAHVALLFTRSEEIGFIGAIGAAREGTVPKGARLVCLENSRSFPHDSPIGAGPIVRVGDRLSV